MSGGIYAVLLIGITMAFLSYQYLQSAGSDKK